MPLPGLPGPYVGSAYTKAASQVFIPELWLSMVQIARDAQLIASRYSMMFPTQGKKGDRFNLPVIGIPPVQDKLPEIPVSLTTDNPTTYSVDITHDKVTAFGVENIVDIQAQYNIMSLYTERHGYALARHVDNDCLGMRAALFNVAAQNVFSSSTGTIAGNGTRFDFAAYLAAKTVLDAADVPDNERVLIVGPQQYNAMINQNFFISSDFVGGQTPVLTGIVGNILGCPVVKTTQIKVNSATGYRNGDLGLPEPTSGVTGSRFLPVQNSFTGLPLIFTGNSRPVMTAMMMHRDWVGSVMNWKPSASKSWENLLQMDAVVFRQVYGMKVYRSDHGVNIHTTADLT